MKKTVLLISLLFFTSMVASTPLSVEIAELLGGNMVDNPKTAIDLAITGDNVQLSKIGNGFLFATANPATGNYIGPNDRVEVCQWVSAEESIDTDYVLRTIWFSVSDASVEGEGPTSDTAEDVWIATGGEERVCLQFDAPEKIDSYTVGVYEGYSPYDTKLGEDTFTIVGDRDGDGILDPNDACPDTAGSEQLDGCIDSDGDGISDPNDRCDNTPSKYAGKVNEQGCYENQYPRSDFSMTTDTTRVSQQVGLSASSSTDPDGNIQQYRWDVDGVKLDGETVTYVPPEPKNVTVELTVVDDGGLEDTSSQRLTVFEAQKSEQTDQDNKNDKTEFNIRTYLDNIFKQISATLEFADI